MTESEAAAALRAFILQKKIATFDYLKMLSEQGATGLAHCGYHDLGTALERTIRDAAKEIEKAIRTHERKFPMKGR